MKRMCVSGLALVWVVLPAVAAEPGFHAQFVGGTVPGISAKAKTHLDLSAADALLVRAGDMQLRIDYRKINSIEYGQNVSRRYAEAILISPVLLLAKSRKHFVTLGYEDESGRQQALVLRVNKGDIRSALASLEARSGRRVEYQDAEARKAGR